MWLLIFLFLNSYGIVNDPILRGVVVDANTNEHIPYAYIQFLDDDGSYITANAKGEFQFEAVGNRTKGRLYVRSLGYEEVYTEFDVEKEDRLKILLKPKPVELGEVEISGEKLQSKIFGDKFGPTTSDHFNVKETFGLIFDTRKEKGRLTKIYFALSAKYGFPEAPILLNVYSFRVKETIKSQHVLDLNQIKPIHDKPILFVDGKAGWNEFDLEPFSLAFEDAFVLIHFIFPNDNPAYLWEKEFTFQGKPITNKYSGPSFESYTSIKTTSIIPLNSARDMSANKLFVSPLFRTNRFRYIPAVALEYDVIK